MAYPTDAEFEELVETLHGQMRALGVPSLVPAAILILRLKGKPYSLAHHYMFEPLFRVDPSPRTILKSARQVGKSQNLAASRLLKNIFMPYYNTLFVCPRFEQVKRISNLYMKPLINESLYKDLFVNPETCEQSILQRSFTSGSVQFFSFALLDAERIRSISASEVAIDEAQDINWDFIPIIAETLSGQEKWRYQTFTGTPKTIENTIERLWSDSSMAEWATKCEHCNKWNIACLEQDALMMLGDTTVVCAKCRRPIDPGTGLWLHKYPTKIEDFRGYHIPQIVHPYHWKNPKFWKDLLYKMRTYPYPKFVNECLGESFDSATKLMTIETLRKIERKEFINDLKTAAKISKDYKFIAMGIDWGGGGSDSKSFTSISIVGLRTGSDVLDTIYLKILPQSMDPTKEITEILHLVQVFNPAKIGHDYGGAGYLREVLLIHAGISPDRIMPFTYVVSPSKQVITYNPGVKGTRTSYSIDRSRSIITLCAMMKAGKVRTPNYESFKHELADFLVIFEDRQERLRSSDLVLIDKVAGAADDTVHSLNYACSTIWYYHQKYPNLAEANEIRLSKEEIARIAPKNITVDDWLQQ